MHTDWTALVVESEFIIALNIEAVLRGMGAAQVVLASNAAEIASKPQLWSETSLAIISVESRGEDSIRLARAATRMGIPVLCLTADSYLADGMPELPGTPFLVKPITDEQLERSAGRLLGR